MPDPSGRGREGRKRGLATMNTASFFSWNAIIANNVMDICKKIAWPAIHAPAASMALLSNNYKISNLIGCAQFLDAKTTSCEHGHQTPPSLPEGSGVRD